MNFDGMEMIRVSEKEEKERVRFPSIEIDTCEN